MQYSLVIFESRPAPITSAPVPCRGVMKCIKAKSVEVIVYEPALEENEFYHSQVIKNLEDFKQESNVILANRLTADLEMKRRSIHGICMVVIDSRLSPQKK